MNLALRIGWREIRRTPGRSALALFLIMLPVIAVTAGDVLQATASVSTAESLPGRMGAAQARLRFIGSPIVQGVDPDSAFSSEPGTTPPSTPARLRTLLDGRPTTDVVHTSPSFRTRYGVRSVEALMFDTTNPMAKGLFRLTAGRLPTKAGEVAATPTYGTRLGATLTQTDGSKVTVTGIVESTRFRVAQMLVAAPGTFPSKGRDVGPVEILAGGAPVTWSDLQRINRAGFTVLSRDVVEHPPPASALPFGGGESTIKQLMPVLSLIAAMVLIEVVLLAGPAFAVGARRRARMLALVAANGGTPAQARRIVLATAVLLGCIASAAGVVVGIGVARLVQPLLQRSSMMWFGPFQVRWSHLLVVAAFGLLSALLAAVVPAWSASRQDPVAVLSNRRDPATVRRRLPVLGLLLLIAGVAGAVWGARTERGGQSLSAYAIALAAVLAVLGMVLCIPAVVTMIARGGRVLPLPLRFALRDAGRNRVRTVPAVAAVAATVAGTVALLIANTTDQTQAHKHYQPMLPVGSAAFAFSGAPKDWPALDKAIRSVVPGARLERLEGVRGMGLASPGGSDLPGTPISGQLGDGALVDSPSTRAMVFPLLRMTPARQRQVEGVLDRGGALVIVSDEVRGDKARLTLRKRTTVVPAAYVSIGGRMSDAVAVVSPTAVAHLGVQATTSSLVALPGAIPASDRQRVAEAVAGVGHQTGYATFEKGYQPNNTQRVVMWILYVLAAVLMLGGTLSATFLALSDARPDLATLAAVGAESRTRRAIAAGYAASVAVVGSLMGVVVGAIPGVAITYPLARGYIDEGGTHLLAVPWLPLIGLVLGLPLVTMLAVSVVSRSRLPMVVRAE